MTLGVIVDLNDWMGMAQPARPSSECWLSNQGVSLQWNDRPQKQAQAPVSSPRLSTGVLGGHTYATCEDDTWSEEAGHFA